MQYNYTLILTSFFSSLAYATGSMSGYCYNNQHQYYRNKATHFQYYNSTDKRLSINQEKITHHSNIGQKKLSHSYYKGANSQNDQTKINKSNEKPISRVDCPVPASHFQNQQVSISNLSGNREQALLQVMPSENKLHPSKFYAEDNKKPYNDLINLFSKVKDFLDELFPIPNNSTEQDQKKIVQKKYIAVIRILRTICKLSAYKIINNKWYIKVQVQKRLLYIICKKDNERKQLNYVALVEESTMNNTLIKKLGDLKPFKISKNDIEKFDDTIPIYLFLKNKREYIIISKSVAKIHSTNQKIFTQKNRTKLKVTKKNSRNYSTKQPDTGSYCDDQVSYCIQFIQIKEEKETILRTRYIPKNEVFVGRFFDNEIGQFVFLMCIRGVKKDESKYTFLVFTKQENGKKFDTYVVSKLFMRPNKQLKKMLSTFRRVTFLYNLAEEIIENNQGIIVHPKINYHTRSNNPFTKQSGESISTPINGTITYYYDNMPTSIYYHRSNSQIALDQMKRLLSSHNMTVSPASQNLNVFNADAPILPKIPTEYALTSASSSPSLMIRSENDREKNHKNKGEEVLLELPLLNPSNIEGYQELDNDSVSLVSIHLSDKSIPDPFYA